MTKEEARKKAEALVAQMTVEEKASQLSFDAEGIDRLGIHEYTWWNEGSHGVARAGTATVFPHAIALAATFDPELVRNVGDTVSTEARIKYKQHITYDDRAIYKGLTFWAPNINIFRDPRWGRGQETFGEDPFLTATMGCAYIRGLQGDPDAPFLKASACSKHFAVHSGPEGSRHGFDAVVSEKDLWETYLPAFEMTVKDGVTGIMGAYNRTNGEPCCAHSKLLLDILRGQWGFDGYITSDCGAIQDIKDGHHYVDTVEEAAALALKKTVDLNCGSVYRHLMDAYEEDLITEEDITRAAVNLFTIRYRLGEFEETMPYGDLPEALLDSGLHREKNLHAAEQAIVLLKNENHFLPLSKATKRIAVIGPNAMSKLALEGNYNGFMSEAVTVADGIRRVYTDSDIHVELGCHIAAEYRADGESNGNLYSDAMATAKNADVTVLCLGLDRNVEGEETGSGGEYSAQGDKNSLGLPLAQKKLAECICGVAENVIVVLLCGSSVDVGETVRNHAKAILHAWYPGAQGGLAVARILSGDACPSGKLPVTVYDDTTVLPPFTSYAMDGRTYRYLHDDVTPLYPFGYGLSYTAFAYRDGKITASDDDTVTLSFTVANTGKRAGTEKAEIYAHFTDSRTATPRYQLCGLCPVSLEAGESKTVSVAVSRYWLSCVLADGTRTTPDGKITLYIGGHQPDRRSSELCGTTCLTVELTE